MRKILQEVHGVPLETIEESVTKRIRVVFQAQILRLRREIKLWQALHYEEVDPQRLVSSPDLLNIFEEFLIAGRKMDGLTLAAARECAAEYIADLRKRYPTKAQLKVIKGSK